MFYKQLSSVDHKLLIYSNRDGIVTAIVIAFGHLTLTDMTEQFEVYLQKRISRGMREPW